MAAGSKPPGWIDARLNRTGIDWLGDRLVMLGACTIALTKMVKVKAGILMLGEVQLSLYDALKAAQEQIDRTTRLSLDDRRVRPHVLVRSRFPM